MSSIKDQIIKALGEITKVKDVKLDVPENSALGDYSTNVVMQNPKLVAPEIVKKFQATGLPVRAEVKGGFINFFPKNDVLVDNLIQISKEKEKYGSGNIGQGKTVVIDYSSPNIAKPFGIGHLRSTIIGQALYNLYQFSGFEVIGDNHLGDWGTQFGKLLYKLQDYSEGEAAKLTIADLEKLYVDFHREAEKKPGIEEEARVWFKKLESGDKKAKELWQACVDLSLKEFDRVYERLGVKIDFAFGESYYQAEMKTLAANPAVKKYLSDGEDGAKIIDLEKEGIKTPLMFLKNDGATTYATRDLATIAFRVRKWNPSLLIYEVGNEQTFYFQQVFAAARLLDLVNKEVKLVHTAHGLYLASDGKKFSTREGKTIKLEEVLDEAVERAKKLGNTGEVAAEVGIGAIKYFDLMHAVASNVVFDWDKMMNLEGNSGPYLQYTVARTNSVLAKSEGGKELRGVSKFNEEESNVLRLLIHFPEVVGKAALNFAPNALCNYLYDLASKFNVFYNKHRILESDNIELRLGLTSAVGQVLKNGLGLLGIKSPDRM